MGEAGDPNAGGATEKKRGVWPLQALNFFMADMQAGIGPFLGVFLLAHGWESGLIGTVMTIGGVAGMIMTAPAGALVDATSRKRLYVIVPGACTVAASAIILLSQEFWLVAASQVATAIAGAAIGPAVAGITLGMVAAGGLQSPERPQPGLQSCRQHGRRGALWLSRLAVRLRRRVLARGCVRRPIDRLGVHDPRRRHRRPRVARAARARRTATAKPAASACWSNPSRS